MSKNRKKSGRSQGRNSHTDTRKQAAPEEIRLDGSTGSEASETPDELPIPPVMEDPASELAQASHQVTFEAPLRGQEDLPDALPLTEEEETGEAAAAPEGTESAEEPVPAEAPAASAEEEPVSENPAEEEEGTEAPEEEEAPSDEGSEEEPSGEEEPADAEPAAEEPSGEEEEPAEEEESPAEGPAPAASVTVSAREEDMNSGEGEEKEIPAWKQFLMDVIDYWNFRGRGGKGKERNPAASTPDPNMMSMAVSLCIVLLIAVLGLRFISLYRSGSLDNGNEAMVGEDQAPVTEIGGVPMDQISFRHKFTTGGHVFAILDMRDFDLETMMETEGISQYDCMEKIAEALGGHMAVIHDAEENQAVFDEVFSYSQRTVFLGGNDQEKEGEWVWVTGEEFSYSNWSEGQPNNGANNEDGSDENYLQFSSITKDGTWNDSPIYGNTYFFLVEWE